MEVYTRVNNCIIKEDESRRFWVFDRNEEKLCVCSFEFAADAISWAYDNQKGILND